jgi:hypothetical protein
MLSQTPQVLTVRDPKELVAHPLYNTIYKVGDTKALELDIERYGLKEPIVIIPPNYIISGVRRNTAHINLGKSSIQCRVLDLTAEDVILTDMLGYNLQRRKIWLEVSGEIKAKRKVIKNRQGARTDKTDEDKINTRKEIAEELGLKENVVRVLEMIGKDPAHHELLERDVETNAIYSLEKAFEKRHTSTGECTDDEFPIISLKPRRCPTCGNHGRRIITDFDNNTMKYIDDEK